MLADVTEIRTHIGRDPRHRLVDPGMRERHEGRDSTPDLDILALEPVDAVGVVARGNPGEDLCLDVLDVLGDLVGDGQISVDDEIEHRVEDGDRAVGAQLGRGLEPAADAAQVADLAEPHRHGEPRADEYSQLTGLDIGGALEVVEDLRDDEDPACCADLDLGPLGIIRCILDLKILEREDIRHERELGFGRLEQPEPHERPRGRLASLLELEKLGFDWTVAWSLPAPHVVEIDLALCPVEAHPADHGYILHRLR